MADLIKQIFENSPVIQMCDQTYRGILEVLKPALGSIGYTYDETQETFSRSDTSFFIHGRIVSESLYKVFGDSPVDIATTIYNLGLDDKDNRSQIDNAI